MSSLAELRKELKEIRKSTVHPVSRMKKADLLAELAKHRGSEVKAVVEEKKAVEKVEKAVKEVKKTVKKVEVAEEKHEKVAEKVAAIKVPKKAPKKEKTEPKAKKSVDPAPVKTETTVLSKHMKSKD
jgi:hypothetical protein